MIKNEPFRKMNDQEMVEKVEECADGTLTMRFTKGRGS